MELESLKNKLLNNTLSNIGLLIFKYDKNGFLVKQYIDKIVELKGFTPCYIDSLDKIESTTLYSDLIQKLYILNTENFNINYNYEELKNVIVICKTIDKKIESSTQNYIIEFPELQDWQIKDYMKVICPGLSDKAYEWLLAITNKDIYKIDNELFKVSLFNELERPEIFNQIVADSTNWVEIDFNKFTNLVLKQDTLVLANALKQTFFLSKLEPIKFLIALITNLKKLILCRYCTQYSLTELDIAKNQAYAINKEYPYFSEQKLVQALNFLTLIDNKIKSGILDKNDLILDYIICGITNILK